MTLTLDSFTEIAFDSNRQVIAREYKSLNAHRAIFEVRGNGSSFSEADFAMLRNEIRRGIRISFFRGFAFGLHLRDCRVERPLMYQSVQGRSPRTGPCEWIIVANEEEMVANGVHMWRGGMTTPIYQSILEGYSDRGFNFSSHVKPPPRLMKVFLALHAIQHPVMHAVMLSKLHQANGRPEEE